MNKYNPDLCNDLIDHMAKGHSFFSYGAICNTTKETILKWTDRHPEFNEARKIGMSKALLYWEKVMDECATARTKMNASMIMFKLRNSFKEMYGDTTKIEHSGAVQLVIDTRIDRPPELVEGEVTSVVELETGTLIGKELL